jgi:hypothetical protein
MRLLFVSLILSASFSAAAAPVIDCRVHFVDEAIHASVDREKGKSSITVKTINLNTDEVERSVTEPATETTEQLDRSINSRSYSLEIVRVGKIFIAQDGSRILSSPGVLTRIMSTGRKQSTDVYCETVLYP